MTDLCTLPLPLFFYLMTALMSLATYCLIPCPCCAICCCGCGYAAP